MNSTSPSFQYLNVFWHVLVVALTTIGVPVGMIALFHNYLFGNPLLVVIIVVFYEVIVFVLGFMGKVWLKLEDPLVSYISEKLTIRVQDIISGYRRQYCQFLVFEHQVFDVKGLSTQTAHALELEHVFVEPSVDPKPAHQTSPDPLRLPESLQKGKHLIWDYLDGNLINNKHLAIIGAPGSGKTTLLKHITLILADRKQYLQKIPQIRRIQQTLPILLFLRDHTRAVIEQSDFSIESALQDHIQKKWHRSVPPHWINQQLMKGTCLILLDGLDEVADPEDRKKMATWVQQQMVAYGRNRFILTSRPHGYRNNAIDSTVLEICPFTPDQVERFVHNWYLANEIKSWGRDDPGVQLRAREGAQDLMQRLHNAPALLSLAVNPLLLTMIATVHRYRSSLPGKRVALYSEICEVFLGKRQEARGMTQELTAAQKQQVLQPLAFYLMQNGYRDLTNSDLKQVIAPALELVNTQMRPGDFIELVQNTSGLLLERDPGVYSFAHQTFQEYLASVHIKEANLEHVLISNINKTWWHETIRLYCAQADATNIILACLAKDRTSTLSLALALECYEEKLKIQPIAERQMVKLLKTGVEDPDVERRSLIAEALLTRRLRQMKHLYNETYIDTSLISCAEYQVFLDESSANNIFRQPEHWLSHSFPSHQGRFAVLGVRPSDAIAFSKWLTERESGPWQYRLPNNEDCKWLDGKNRIIHLEPGTGYWIDEGRGFVWSETTPSSLSSIIGTSGDTFNLYRDFTNALTRSRNNALTRILTRDLDTRRTRSLTRYLSQNSTNNSGSGTRLIDGVTLDRSLNFARDLASIHFNDPGFDYVLDFDIADSRILDLALGKSSTKAFASIVGRELDHARFLIQNPTIAHVFDNIPTRSYKIANTIKNNLDQARSFLENARNLSMVLDLADTLIRAEYYARDINPNYDRLVHDRAIDLGYTLKYARDIARIFAISMFIDYARVRIFDRRNLIESSKSDEKAEVILLLRSIGDFTQVIARSLHYWLRLSSIPKQRKEQSFTRSDNVVFQQAIKNYLNLHAAITLFSLRFQSKLPVCEGILLVKEGIQ